MVTHGRTTPKISSCRYRNRTVSHCCTIHPRYPPWVSGTCTVPARGCALTMSAATGNLGAQCGSSSARARGFVALHHEPQTFRPFQGVSDDDNNDIPRQFNRRPPKMADPFEVRMRFTSQLQHLNASVTSAQKAAQYALKYKDMDEDLHSCILEQLERVS